MTIAVSKKALGNSVVAGIHQLAAALIHCLHFNHSAEMLQNSYWHHNEGPLIQTVMLLANEPESTHIVVWLFLSYVIVVVVAAEVYTALEWQDLSNVLQP